MADDRFDSRPTPLRESLPWTDLFRTFRVALDPKKLLLAAAGILAMACGWWLISVFFYWVYPIPVKERGYQPPSLSDIERQHPELASPEARNRFQADEQEKLNKDYDAALSRWVQAHRLAGSGYEMVTFSDGTKAKVWGGRFRTLPWFEDRGPNPYLLITDPSKPWEKGHFFDWFTTHQVPVLLEPLVKFLEPIVALINPRTGTGTRIYLMIIVLWTLAVWALFGGAITRMAAVELAGKDTVDIKAALRFVANRYLSYFGSPLVPLGLIAVLILVDIVLGVLQLIPFLGDFTTSLLWPILILTGLGKALLLVGLVGYPMMYPTISAEGSDTLDALSRSYNYVYQSPWNYIWYSLVAILYGAVVIFFVGLVGTMTAMLGKWGMSFTPGIESARRSPEYLFVYAPTSFGWRETLLKGSPGERITVIDDDIGAMQRRGVDGQAIDEKYAPTTELGREKTAADENYNRWLATFWWYNKVAAYIMAFWVALVFLIVLGFGYSFFWTASTMIYLLMRRKVDDTDIDEVYLEEEPGADPYAAGPPTTLPLTAPPPPPAPATQMVDLNVRTSPPPAAPVAPPEPPPPAPPPPAPATADETLPPQPPPEPPPTA
jgi:hypothetical protein